MTEPDLERLLREALAAEAPPMSEAQAGEVVARAAVLARPAPEFPPWVIAASAVSLAALGLLAGLPGSGEWLRILAGAAAAANLALSPLAALVLVRGRRKAHAD